ncbi:alpha/beta hydrolase [Mycolicibacterium arenosum]|uniref:Alpha/beta fold hydrolase n=1 Tax=Mycolicibacterium arenosum TaxID=2952157 RepID=A0ABT1M4M2_9MYCO|nr:alpha/beta fold hydrolase [Mycolicibacterium sp. CAU 1645]MCP9274078.1 alpha/beta fold hydrolase [Mycolicibacterium sp. CAU 1645]
MLEVIDKGAASDAHPTPLLFIHGAWHGAWCWDEHFLDFFADRGYRAVALSLRGHGSTPDAKAVRFASINDYVDDVESIASGLPTRPVVIGHSMGGFIVQTYLESHDAPAGILVASMPPHGARRFIPRMFQRRAGRAVRALTTGKSLQYFDSLDTVRTFFFSPTTPEADVVRYASRLCEESARISVDSLGLNLPKPALIKASLLVVGAEYDGCFSTDEVHVTAAAYGTEAVMFPMGHDVMLEPGWRDVAEHIDGWLVGRGL